MTAPGGFIEWAATSTEVRMSPVVSLPDQGMFQFPAPFNTLGIRVTNTAREIGRDALWYTGYSYWKAINAHRGQPFLRVFLCLDRNRGGPGPCYYEVDKTTGMVDGPIPIFRSEEPLSWATGEGWYWSRHDPAVLYCADYQHLYRRNVETGYMAAAVDTTPIDPQGIQALVQWHTADDERTHSATIKDTSTDNWLATGTVVYREGLADPWLHYPARGPLDESHIDASGQWLLIKENIDGEYGEDNRIIHIAGEVERLLRLTRSEAGLRSFRQRRAQRSPSERVLLDQGGAAGHSDNGYGYMVAADNWNDAPGAIRLWMFDETKEPQGRLVYRTSTWNAEMAHVSHQNAGPDTSPDALARQYAVGSGATRTPGPRNNEIVGFRLDGSLECVVIAPVMTDLDAPGGGVDTYPGEHDYAKLPKGNLDDTGHYFLMTSNAGSAYLDAFLVLVPDLLTDGAPPEPVCTHGCPVHCPP